MDVVGNGISAGIDFVGDESVNFIEFSGPEVIKKVSCEIFPAGKY